MAGILPLAVGAGGAVASIPAAPFVLAATGAAVATYAVLPEEQKQEVNSVVQETVNFVGDQFNKITATTEQENKTSHLSISTPSSDNDKEELLDILQEESGSATGDYDESEVPTAKEAEDFVSSQGAQLEEYTPEMQEEADALDDGFPAWWPFK